MGATSATGRGQGASNKPTTVQLAAFANGPNCYMTGRLETVQATDPPVSPDVPMATVVLPTPLPGTEDDYVVLVTSLNAGAAYVMSMNDDDTGFTGFIVTSEAEGTVMYGVFGVGVRAAGQD